MDGKSEDIAKHIWEELTLDPFDAEEGQRNMQFLSEMVEKIRAEAYERAVQVADKFTEGRQCSPNNSGHDDRWCEVCETAKDTAEVIATAIRKLGKGGE